MKNTEETKKLEKANEPTTLSNLDLVSSLSNNVLAIRDATAPIKEAEKTELPIEEVAKKTNTKAVIKTKKTPKKYNKKKQQKAKQEDMAWATSDTGHPHKLLAIYNKRVDCTRRAVKLDKRIMDSIIKNTLTLNLPLYRIIELILIEHCLKHYPSCSNDMTNLLTQLRSEEK